MMDRMASIGAYIISGRSAVFVRRLAILFTFFASLFSLSACVPSYSSGGGPARNLFSHAAYHFALANTTTTAASSRNRTMGVVRLENEEVRARLPQGAGNVTVTYRLLPGDNELVATFFEVNASSGRLLFKSDGAQDFSLGHVVRVLGVREFEVAADISYLDRDGERRHWASVSVPVRISAAARALETEDFVIFNGFTRAGTERVTVVVETNNRTFEGRVELGFPLMFSFFSLSKKDPLLYSLFRDNARSVVYPTEAIFQTDFWDSEGMGENRIFRLNQALNISILLRLTENGVNHRNLSLTYRAAKGMSRELFDDIHTREGSLRHFLVTHPNVTSAPEDIFNLDPAAKSGFGADLESIRFAFPFFYQREVLQTEERIVERRRHHYELVGMLNENAPPYSVVSGAGNVLRTLGIQTDLSAAMRAQAGLDRPPTLYFRLQSGFNRTDNSAYCSRRFYLDNQGYRILLGSEEEVDFEARSRYYCSVRVSLTGLSDDYTDVTTGILGDVPERYDRKSLFFGQVARTNPPVSGACSGGILGTRPEFEQCNYLAWVDIQIQDRDEATVLSANEATGVNLFYEGDTGMAGVLDGLPDDDGDRVLNGEDACDPGETDWRSNRTTDNDKDGCRDAGEDTDDDNDHVPDTTDAFPRDACASTDTDQDGNPDSVVAGCQTDLMADSDDDNNGLIEIRTLDDLARLRDDLNGDGADDNRTDEITAVGSAGCPSSGCLGYELTRSLNFSLVASYGSNGENSGKQSTWTDRDGSGWVPIGFCTSNNVCTAYTGVFDGRDHTIADLFVSAHHDAIGVGLFGAFNGSLQNLHLRNARVSGGANDVGTLVGNGRNAGYENLSVTGGSVMSPSAGNVGGLVGDGEDADIRYAYVFGGSVAGGDEVGGLVGSGANASIIYANVSGVNVSGDVAVGGLVGDGEGADIHYAYVSGGDVSGNVTVGGLVGDGEGADIRYSYVLGGSVAGDDEVGGLVGKGREVDIRYAYVFGGSVAGGDEVGGLVGDGYRSDIRYAYVLGGSVAGDDEVGGLVGIGGGQDSQIYYSYVAAGFVLGSGGDIGGLIGIADAQITVNASYWDTETTGQSTGAGGDGQSTVQLQGASFTGIYALWGNFWCNPNTGEETESTSQPIGFVRVWDLGESSQYPALNCMPGGISAQGR